ncbi:MAG: hypothetical protein EP332_06220 [Bacteroidetes bacterium]|nr:MAG: hypothetical protein EP332_06220 [Bacteroidota bacterium]
MKKSLLLLSSLWAAIPAFAQNNSEAPRRTSIQHCIETDQDSLRIDLWDAGVEDNDTVTLILNGQTVLESFRLSKAKSQFTFPLQPGDNKLSLFANNLGDIPNNTAAISVNGGEQISLKSGLDVNGTLNVRYKAPGMMFTQVVCETETAPDDNEASAIRSNPELALPSYSLLQRGLSFKAGEPARKVEVQDCYNSSYNKIKIWYWDCGVEDNDTVSLYLNGSWILTETRLTKEPKFIEVELNPGENMLTLYAHNLGDIPKNTAAISVEHPYGKADVGKMISDANTCGAIRISYGMQTSYGVSIPPCLDKNEVDSTTEPEVVYLLEIQNRNKVSTPGKNNGTVTKPRQPNQPVYYPPTPRPRTSPAPAPRPVPQTRPAPKPTPSPAPSTRPAPTKPTPPPASPAPNTTPDVRDKPKPAY